MKTHPTLLALAAAALAAGTAAAEPAKYTLDPSHTYPSFEADHMGISLWRGKFNRNTGSVMLDKAAGQGTVEVQVDLSGVDFGHNALNKWARGKEFFDTAKYPLAIYKGRLVDFVNGAPTKAVGELTLHGVTRPLELKIASFKCIAHPMLKRDYCGADIYGTIKRDEFGLDAGKDYGFKMEVALRIQAEAIADK
jgi:polyisoprenoid-binding protein YceI